jgi:hypothetical protein
MPSSYAKPTEPVPDKPIDGAMRPLLLLLSLLGAFALTASTASARVVQRAHTDQRFGIVSAGGAIRQSERYVSFKVVSVPSRTLMATLSVACIRADNSVAVARKNVKRRMAPFTLTVRRPRSGSRCFASASAQLAQQLLPQGFRSSIWAKLTARR